VNIYYVTNVSDADSCTNSQLGDIRGTNTITIKPRPTAVLVSTNLANFQFATNNCDVFTAYYITNRLTGNGPWDVWWNDGYHTNTGPSGPATFIDVRTVVPTNNPGTNLPSVNIYYVTNVSRRRQLHQQPARRHPGHQHDHHQAAADGGAGLDQPAELPIRHEQLRRVHRVLYYQSADGHGPWDVWWNDGYHTNTGPSGPATFTDVRTVVPTNNPGTNLPSVNIYYVTNVSDADSAPTASSATSGAPTRSPSSRGRRRCWSRPTCRTSSSPRTTATCSPRIILPSADGQRPWDVWWNDGYHTNTGPSGPATFIDVRTVVPTNNPARTCRA